MPKNVNSLTRMASENKALTVFNATRTHWPCPVSERLAKQLSKKIRFVRLTGQPVIGKFLLS